MINVPKSILGELVLHLSYDSGVNGSKFTDSPVGRLVLADSSDALWRRVCDVQHDNSPEQKILAELVEELRASAESLINTTYHIGGLSLQVREGSLWKRALDVLGYEPDMVRDVVAPVINARLAE